MALSFVRIDDRVIHGQLVTRWAKELPCDGIVAIDDEVAADALLASVMKGAIQDIPVWLFTVAQAIEKLPKVIASSKHYFVIGKSPVTLQHLAKAGIDLHNRYQRINVGPMSARADTVTIGVRPLIFWRRAATALSSGWCRMPAVSAGRMRKKK